MAFMFWNNSPGANQRGIDFPPFHIRFSRSAFRFHRFNAFDRRSFRRYPHVMVQSPRLVPPRSRIPAHLLEIRLPVPRNNHAFIQQRNSRSPAPVISAGTSLKTSSVSPLDREPIRRLRYPFGILCTNMFENPKELAVF